MISEREIWNVTEELSPKDLQHLYVALNLSQVDVEHAEYGHTDSKFQGRAVLMEWRKQRPDEATKRTILEALEYCRNKGASRALLERWK